MKVFGGWSGSLDARQGDEAIFRVFHELDRVSPIRMEDTPWVDVAIVSTIARDDRRKDLTVFSGEVAAIRDSNVNMQSQNAHVKTTYPVTPLLTRCPL